MKPKNLNAFYLFVITSQAGLWLFAYAVYGLVIQPLSPSYTGGVNFSAVASLYGSWGTGLLALAFLVFAYTISPVKKK